MQEFLLVSGFEFGLVLMQVLNLESMLALMRAALKGVLMLVLMQVFQLVLELEQNKS
jgi:hypothetical protein